MAGKRKTKTKKKQGKSAHSKAESTPNKASAEAVTKMSSESDEQKESEKEIPPTCCNCKEEESIEKLLLETIELHYKKALEKVMSFNFSFDLAFRAMLASGVIYGNSNIYNNIVMNCIYFLDTGCLMDPRLCDSDGVPRLKDMRELALLAMYTLIAWAQRSRPSLTRLEAMRHILEDTNIFTESFSDEFFDCDHEHECKNDVVKEESERQLEETADTLRKMEINPATPSVDISQKSAASQTGEADKKTETVMALVDQIGKLTVQLKERKEWAQERVMQSARRLSNDHHELIQLRMEKLERESSLKENDKFENYAAEFKVKQELLRRMNCEVARLNEIKKNAETRSLSMKADIAAFKLNASENESALRTILKKEKRSQKRAMDLQIQVAEIKSHIEEEKEKIVQAETNLVQAAEGGKQARFMLMQEMEAKEQARLLFLEEERLCRQAKEESRTRLAAVRQELNASQQRSRDEIQMLKLELSQLQQSDASLPSSSDDNFRTRRRGRKKTEKQISVGGAPPDSHPSSSHLCLICGSKYVNVLFLPCAHEVICEDCNSKTSVRLEDKCPVCQVKIERKIKVYGPTM